MLAIGNAFYTLLSRLAVSEIRPRIETVIHPAQGGFVAKRSTVDQLYLIQSLQHDNAYMLSLDISKAYDSVDRAILLKKLAAAIPETGTWYMQLAMLAYATESTGIIQCRDGASEPIELQKGVRQGDPVSPILFNLYIDDVVRVLAEPVGTPLPELQATEGGEGIPLGVLAYADDLMVISHDRAELATRATKAWDEAARVGLSFNPAKCGFWAPDAAEPPLTFAQGGGGDDAVVPHSSSIYYLGQFLGDTDKLVDRYITRFGRRLTLLRPLFTDRELSFRSKRLLLIMVARASVEYATFVGEFPDHFWTRAERMLSRARKQILSVSPGTLSLAAELESGIKQLRTRAKHLGTSYAWSIPEKLEEHRDNPYVQFLYSTTAEAREASQELYDRYLERREAMHEARKHRALPDVYAAPVSLASYLSLDFDREENDQWRQDVRSRIHASRNVQKAKAKHSPMSTGEAYLGMSAAGHPMTQNYPLITRVRLGESLRARHSGREGSLKRGSESFWDEYRACHTALSTTHRALIGYLAGSKIMAKLRSYLVKFGLQSAAVSPAWEVLTFSGLVLQDLKRLRDWTPGPARWAVFERLIFSAVEAVLKEGRSAYIFEAARSMRA